jgi:hypothetical protein
LAIGSTKTKSVPLTQNLSVRVQNLRRGAWLRDSAILVPWSFELTLGLAAASEPPPPRGDHSRSLNVRTSQSRSKATLLVGPALERLANVRISSDYRSYAATGAGVGLPEDWYQK